MGSRQLFLSRRVVTEAGVSNGGVLVDEDGIIEELLTREQADQLIADSDGKIKVNTVDRSNKHNSICWQLFNQSCDCCFNVLIY